MKPHTQNSFKIISFYSFLFIFAMFSQAQDVAWEKMFLYDAMGIWNESSELDDRVSGHDELGKYCACWLFDKDLTTAWVEGVKSDGIGEYVLLGHEKALPDKIHINNGYQKSESVYRKNGRPKVLRLSLYVAYYLPDDFTELGGNFYCLPFPDSILLELNDEMGTQAIELAFNKEKIGSLKKLGDLSFKNEFGEIIAERLNTNSDNDWYEEFYGFVVKLEIIDVYKGSRWDDTCISDIWFSTEKKKDPGISADEKITEIFKGEDGNIYFSTSMRERILLASPLDIENEEDIISGEPDIVLMDVSPDKEWAQIDFLFSHEAYVRVEEVAFLYNVRHGIKVDKSVLGDYYSMYGFLEENGKIFVDTDKGMFDLEEILKMIRE